MGESSPERKAWTAMWRRCTNPWDRAWSNYGERGIGVCQRWSDFSVFLKDMGPRPSPSHSLDRIDNGGDYEPGNCRWATITEQSRNRRTNRVLVVDGRALSVTEWAEVVGIPRKTIYRRLEYGWSDVDAVTRPLS